MPGEHPINIRLIDHVVIRAADVGVLVDFYCEVLGCEIERGEDQSGLVQLRAGLSLIDIVAAASELGRGAGSLPDQQAPNMDHVCLQIAPWDSKAILNHLHRNGVAAGDVASRYGADGYGPSIYIKDPEGNTVELKGPASVD
ncbi:MAG: VOC family protein [Woeseiaceae bacterium]|nr:VOC family protein [Woeseiaceae bacterium]NIP21454.1 VOC family protein [Woeseiaceae bacterium]